jgi:beta-N-acetylhexosaminidase
MPSKSSLELLHQVGQLLIMGLEVPVLSARLRLSLATFRPSGIILFQRNIKEAAQTHALLRETQKAVSTPMFLCIDMEGGTVDRLREIIAPVPSVAAVASAGSPKLFRKHGRIIGAEVRAIGFNTDFAPVLDLQFEASKDVLTSRTISPDVKQTIRYASEFLRGLRDCDVLACGKHFPGLGGASVDSHTQLPSIIKPWKNLWNEDLLPYRELQRGLPFVMVAHAAYPQVTGKRTPASLSKKWISGILREKIGYGGLVLTDDLDMGGVLAAAPIEDAAVETLRAGADMFLVCQKEESVWRAFEAVYKRAENDKKFARLISEKSQRVLLAKKKSRALKDGLAPAPQGKVVESMRRDIREFCEEVRAQTFSFEAAHL